MKTFPGEVIDRAHPQTSPGEVFTRQEARPATIGAMFEAAELGRTVSKDEYRTLEPALRADLLAEQVRLRDAPFPVIIVFAGVSGAGKGETVNLLNAWMDPRWLVTRAFGDPSDEERERPEFWRYWLNLPSRGRIGMYLSSWYSEPASRPCACTRLPYFSYVKRWASSCKSVIKKAYGLRLPFTLMRWFLSTCA